MAKRKVKNKSNYIPPKNLFSFIQEELSFSGITLKDLNSKTKYKDLRYSFVNRAFIRYLETEPPTSKEETIKYIRQQTGVKFSNDVGRLNYNKLKNINNAVGYGARVNKNKLPKLEKIPKIDAYVQDAFMYGFKVFVYDSKSKRKNKALPKSAQRISNGKYNGIKDFVFWSEILLTGQDARIVAEILMGNRLQDLGQLETVIEGSDYQQILRDKSLTIIGFKYDRLVRT